jgi:hypothetical protein
MAGSTCPTFDGTGHVEPDGRNLPVRITINPGPNDTIDVADDWGYADGIRIGSKDSDVILYLLTEDRIAEMRRALDQIETARIERQRELDRDDDDALGMAEHYEVA